MKFVLMAVGLVGALVVQGSAYGQSRGGAVEVGGGGELLLSARLLPGDAYLGVFALVRRRVPR